MFDLGTSRPTQSNSGNSAGNTAAPPKVRAAAKASATPYGSADPQAMLRSLSRGPTLQRKLEVGSIDDPLERSADATADRVMRGPDSENIEPGTQRSGTPAGIAPESVHETLRSPGQVLDRATRAWFEPRFGFDFSSVRLHTGEQAANSAREIGAQAYAAGEHVVFGRGAYTPGTSAGRRLLAHELTHVVQQTQGGAGLVQREPIPTDDGGEATPAQTPPGQAPPGKAPTAAAAAAACAEVPDFNSTSQPPTTVLADNVDQFIQNYYAQIGDPYTKPSDTENFDIDGKGIVTKVNMKVDIAISRPRWGGGRPANDQQKALILKCVDVIKDHENQHQAIAKQWYATAVCDALGKKAAAATKAINDVVCTKMATAQEDFDMKHGLIQVVHDAQGNATDVITVPVTTRPNYKC